MRGGLFIPCYFDALTRTAFTGALDDVTDTVIANWRYL
jgi:hypothetical protein